MTINPKYQSFLKAPCRCAILILGLMLGFAWMGVLTGCGRLGSEGVRQGRHPLSDAIRATSNEELLLSLVKLRYGNLPGFLDVISVNTQLQWQAGFGGQYQINAGGGGSGYIGPSLGYSETPTLSYKPLTGKIFMAQMLEPIDLRTLLLLLQCGWEWEKILRLTVHSMNGLDNAYSASRLTQNTVPRFRKFSRAARLFSEIQGTGVLQFSAIRGGEFPVKRWQVDPASIMEWSEIPQMNPIGLYVIDNEESETVRTQLNELKHMLKLDRKGEDVNHFRLEASVSYIDDQTISVVTRSLWGILFYVSHAVQVPPEHLKAGLAPAATLPDGRVFDWGEMTGDLITIRSSREPPKNAEIMVPYRDYWYYIADNDIQSKATFMLVTLLGTLQAGTGTNDSGGPVLTLPVGR